MNLDYNTRLVCIKPGKMALSTGNTIDILKGDEATVIKKPFLNSVNIAIGGNRGVIPLNHINRFDKDSSYPCFKVISIEEPQLQESKRIKSLIKLLEKYTNKKVVLKEAKIPFESKITYEEQQELNAIKLIKDRLKRLNAKDYPLDDYDFTTSIKKYLKDISIKLYSFYSKSELVKALNSRVNQINNKYKSSEEIKSDEDKKRIKQDKESRKRSELRSKKNDIENERLKTLTPRQNAINKLVSLKNRLNDITSSIRMAKFSYGKEKILNLKQQYQKLKEEFDSIKLEFNIKSDEIRKQ